MPRNHSKLKELFEICKIYKTVSNFAEKTLSFWFSEKGKMNTKVKNFFGETWNCQLVIFVAVRGFKKANLNL